MPESRTEFDLNELQPVEAAAPSFGKKIDAVVTGEKPPAKNPRTEFSVEELDQMPKPDEGVNLGQKQMMWKSKYSGEYIPVSAPMIVGPQAALALEAAGPLAMQALKHYGGEAASKIPEMLKIGGGVEVAKQAVGAIGRRMGLFGKHKD